jgi:hypothetical protein
LRSLGQLFLTLCLVAEAGCSLGRPVRPQRFEGDQHHVLQPELESTKQATLYDAIKQARPFWLARATGDGSVAVYLDNQLVGGLSNLRRISVHVTSQVRFMSATEAQVRFGQTNAMRPAILVETRR